MLTIWTVERTLDDGSKVYEVSLMNEYRERIVLPAVTLTDAHELADKLESAILRHTNETVKQEETRT
jgi:hypothetical protein